MAKDEGALKPTILGIKDWMKTDVKDDESTVEEKVLAAGANTAFWKNLKQHFDISIQQLEQINEQAMASGMPLEEIGRNALVISQVKGVLNKIINKVQDAKEALDVERGKAK